MAKRVLAFDFGASSGRAMIGTFDGHKITLEEVHRFSNDPVNLGGTFYWDILRLFFEIKQGITKAVNAGGFDTIGIDTWGVDFGLLDEEGRLLENPVHYRDARTEGMIEKMFKVVSKEEIYSKTGIQFLTLNTLTQFFALAKTRPELLSRADKMLFIPDLFNYFLTGEMKSEYTITSTSQMMNPKTGDWDWDLIEKFGFPKKLFPSIIEAGTVVGKLSDDICEELGAPKVDVIAVASHDTASAVVAVPATEKDFVYISCGTWSLFGVESEVPYMNEKTLSYNLTNEGGYDRTIRFLKNIMGLWMIQESRRQWIREGQNCTYNDLEKEALAEKPFACFIDPDDDRFVAPGNFPKRVREYCQETGQYVPQSRGEVMRCIYESLAMKYRMTKEMIEDCTGKKYHAIHMVGGGTKDNLLCQLTANCCHVNVVAGPIEATALGNVAVQLMATKDIACLEDARKVVINSFDPIHYTPNNDLDWDEAYIRFTAVLKK